MVVPQIHPLTDGTVYNLASSAADTTYVRAPFQGRIYIVGYMQNGPVTIGASSVVTMTAALSSAGGAFTNIANGATTFSLIGAAGAGNAGVQQATIANAGSNGTTGVAIYSVGGGTPIASNTASVNVTVVGGAITITSLATTGNYLTVPTNPATLTYQAASGAGLGVTGATVNVFNNTIGTGASGIPGSSQTGHCFENDLIRFAFGSGVTSAQPVLCYAVIRRGT